MELGTEYVPSKTERKLNSRDSSSSKTSVSPMCKIQFEICSIRIDSPRSEQEISRLIGNFVVRTKTLCF